MPLRFEWPSYPLPSDLVNPAPDDWMTPADLLAVGPHLPGGVRRCRGRQPHRPLRGAHAAMRRGHPRPFDRSLGRSGDQRMPGGGGHCRDDHLGN